MKKVVVIGIIILFLLTGFTSISGIQINENIVIPSYKGNTLYVGGSGEGNYSSIQDAIDNASDGDIVFVFDDSSPYFENVIVNKSIELIGENRDTTIIGHIRIEKGGNGVNVSGFTSKQGLFIDYKVSDIVISDNHFIGRDAGIGFCGDNSIIDSNTFTNCEYSSIYLDATDVSIINNVFTYKISNSYAEYVIYCYSSNFITISNNTFICHPNYYVYFWLYFQNARNFIIEYNEFNGHSDAIRLWGGSSNNIISYNTFINSSLGISIHASYNKIINNNFINNDNGIIIFSFSDYNRVLKNNFINNTDDAHSSIFNFNNTWDGNYWDKWIGLKYPILSFLPYFSFSFLGSFIDWNPAKQPYNYTITQEYDLI